MFAASALVGFAEDRRVENLELEFDTIHGGRVTPFKMPSEKGTILFFTMHDCPIANTFSPEVRRIAQHYGKKGFELVLVYAEPSLEPKAARAHFQDFQHGQYPAMIDSNLIVARAVGAKVTPEAVVLDKKGTILYRGRLNNLYADFGRKRPKPTQNDLRDALSLIIAGEKPPTPWPRSVGCYIPFNLLAD